MPENTGAVQDMIPAALQRKTPTGLPEASELDVVRHYTRLSQKNYSIDTQFYPLGSCTMKYNPRVDVIHMNLHKTFSTPHGGGGPGSGAIGVNTRLLPFMPVPYVGKDESGYHLVDREKAPKTIGRLSAFAGNAGVNLRAYIYALLLGKEGMQRVAEFATLNANYLMKELEKAGFDLAFPTRRASHEFIITLKNQAKELGLTATDLAKALLDHDMHAPTIYFPLLVSECLLIEPTETESKQTMDRFVKAMQNILEQAKKDISPLKAAPRKAPVRRLDDVKALVCAPLSAARLRFASSFIFSFYWSLRPSGWPKPPCNCGC